VYFMSLFRVSSGYLFEINREQTQTFHDNLVPNTFWNKTNKSFIHNN
jgi:hypothetical protein